MYLHAVMRGPSVHDSGATRIRSPKDFRGTVFHGESVRASAEPASVLIITGMGEEFYTAVMFAHVLDSLIEGRVGRRGSELA